MAGPNGGVWGNEVIVPEGEKLSSATAQFVKPAEETPESAAAEKASGDENTETGSGTQTPQAPVVRLPDGTEVPVSDYDPYAEQRATLEKEQSRVDGMLSVINSNTENRSETQTETDSPEHPLLADTPLLQKIDISTDDEGLFDDEKRANAERHNNLVDYAKQQNQTIVELETKHQREIDAIKNEVGDRFLREDIARATATTGVTEQELFAASKASGITDVQTLATLIVGEKAIQTANEEAEAAAAAKRTEDAGHIGGASQGGGTGGGGTQHPEGRGVQDWRDAKSVGAAYKFGST